MLRSVLLALALALALSGGALFLGGSLDLASTGSSVGAVKAAGDADPTGATVEAVGMHDPNGAAATGDAGSHYDPNG